MGLQHPSQKLEKGRYAHTPSQGAKKIPRLHGIAMDCGDEGCGYCRVCRRLNFLEWVGQVAPRDVPCSISPDHDVDAYIARTYNR